ncbi:hypothetical protein NBH00_15580 [Paraconexibacter antarcticus]|uniref:Peptidase M14 domain-containing protein n=1 Tax=Paraconexibacter antarcticus TaxID=2949664 RepID=A0ABY5DLP7_9ACTN|nr:M14 family zinc carboxypeptidase [Paraconexibacter antarcticus]UTI62778.1 hypothetical protein NBH00_15580 [Paraconexibacter antarcticus]
MRAARGQRAATGLALACALLGGVGLGVPTAATAAGAVPPRVSVERVPLTAPAVQVPELEALGLDVTEDVTPRSATVIARSDAQRRALRAAGFAPVTVVPDELARLRSAAAASVRAARLRAATPRASGLPSGRTTYRTPAEVQADLDTLAAGHPGLVRRITLPERSVDGQPITGVEIAANVDVADDGRPVYVVLGEHHAREWPSAEIALEFALDLVQHQADPRIAPLLAAERIVVVPVVNPDGYAYSRGTLPGGQLNASAALKRRNCRADAGDPAGGGCARHRGVDLNRNYGAFWGGPGASTSADDDTYRGTGPWSEPEAQAVHEFTQHLAVTGVQSLHDVAGLVLRPPGFRALGLAPDEARLKALGDAMGAATGYASRFGYELYEVTGATEDWNYVAQGAFGYTIETAGAFPGDTDFQGTYQTHVVDQYLGGGASPGPAGKGVREALLLAAEEAADPRDHTIVRGRVPAGVTLRLHKDFTTVTSPRCSDSLSADACGPTGTPLATPDVLDVTLAAPAGGGAFSWHVGPSTRPFARARGTTETWTLTCERAGAVLATKAVFADRGQVVDVDPCDPASLPRTREGAGSVARTAGRVSATAPRQTRASVVRHRQLMLAVTCPVACRATMVVSSGSRTVASLPGAGARLAARRSTLVRARLSAAGRALLARGAGPRRLTARVLVRAADGDATTLTRRIVVARG